MAKRDEFGHVIMPMDWREGLPADFLRAVEEFVLVDDVELGTDRIDAIRFLDQVVLDGHGSRASGLRPTA